MQVLADTHNDRGTVLAIQGQYGAALACYREALRLRPHFPGALSNLGNVLHRCGQRVAAIQAFQAALSLQPQFPEPHNNLGLLFQAQGDREAAAAAYRRAVLLRPDFPEAWLNMALLYLAQGQITSAQTAIARALVLAPAFAEAWNTLGNILHSEARHAEAATAYRRALMLRPDHAVAGSNLCFTALYNPQATAVQIRALHCDWAARHALAPSPSPSPSPLLGKSVYPQSRASERLLRIGYVSADFRDHPVSTFLLPVLEAHDRSRFAVFGYSQSERSDAMTGAIRQCCVGWCETAGLNDTALAERIRADQIDILVDLSGHTEGNRLPVFARRPAPVQVSWIGYPATTGLSAIDYRLTDPVADPPGAEAGYSETLIRLSVGFLAFAPPGYAPPVSPLPALISGTITFGSFNKLAKLTESTLALWGAVLRRLPTARLYIKSKGLAEAETGARLWARCAAQGIAEERIRIAPWTTTTSEHLAHYAAVDIALDSTPYSGTTTTCEALWMGVPVITRCGALHPSRVSASLLHRLDLGALVADSDAAYVDIAATLAADLPRLAALRARLRARCVASSLCDGPRLTRSLENAYRAIWQRWVGSAGTGDERLI